MSAYPQGSHSSVIIHTDFGKEVFESALQWGFIEAKPIDKSGADLIHKMMNEREERSRDCREGEEDEEVDGTVTGT